MKVKLCYINENGKHYCGMAAILHYAKEHQIDVSEAVARLEDINSPNDDTVLVK